MRPIEDPALLDRLAAAVVPAGAPRDWRGIGEGVGEAWHAFAERAEPGEDIVPARDLPVLIAAVIERLGAPPVAGAEQAGLYELSGDLAHRVAGAAWRNAHPEALSDRTAESALRPLQEIAAGRSPPPPLDVEVVFDVRYKEEDRAWIAESATEPYGICADARTLDLLANKLAALVADVAELVHNRAPSEVRINMRWTATPAARERELIAS